MKYFVIIFNLCFLTFVASQNVTTFPDYSPFVNMTNIFKKLLAAYNVSSPPIESSYVYYGYWNYLPFNQLFIDFASAAGNVSLLFIYPFQNFTITVNDKVNYPQSIVDLQNAIVSMMDTNLQPFTETFPESWQPVFLDLLATTGLEEKNLELFVNAYSDNAYVLPYINQPVNSLNVYKFLPSPYFVSIWTSKLMNLTNAYVNFFNKTGIDLMNLYTLFKSNNPSFVAVEVQKNQTFKNFTSSANASKIFASSTVNNLTSSIWTIYKKFVTGLPAPVKNSTVFKNAIAVFETMLGQFNGTLLNATLTYGQIIDNYWYSVILQYIEGYYQTIISYSEQMRFKIFEYYTANTKTLNCTAKFVAALEAVLKSYGGPTAIFNCTNLESGIFLKLQSLIATFFANFNADVSLYLAVVTKCLGAGNITDDPNTQYPYSVMHCLKTNGKYFWELPDSIRQQLFMIGSLAEQYLNQSLTRLQYCLNDKYSELLAAFGPAFINYTICCDALVMTSKG